jgi:hypothetical protein
MGDNYVFFRKPLYKRYENIDEVDDNDERFLSKLIEVLFPEYGKTMIKVFPVFCGFLLIIGIIYYDNLIK